MRGRALCRARGGRTGGPHVGPATERCNPRGQRDYASPASGAEGDVAGSLGSGARMWRIPPILAASLPPEQPHQLLDRKTRVGDDATECAGSDLPVVGNDDSGMRCVAPQDHVTARLPPEHEARQFQGGPYLPAGEIGRKLCHEPGVA